MKLPFVSRERFEASERERLRLLDMLLNDAPVADEERVATRRVVPRLEKDPTDVIAEEVDNVRQEESVRATGFSTPFDERKQAFSKRFPNGQIPSKFRVKV